MDIMETRAGSAIFMVTDTVCKIARMLVVVVGNKTSQIKKVI